MAAGRGPVVPGLVGAERGQRPRRHQEPRRARRGAGGWRLSGQKTWTHPRRVLHPPLRPVPQRPDGRAPPRPHLLPRAPRRARASPCAGSDASTATRASPRCSSTTCSSPTATSSAGSTTAGAWPWRPPARSAASRCAAPAASSPPRAAAASTCAAPRPGRRRAGPRATRSSQAWIDAEAYRLADLLDGHAPDRRRARSAPRRASTRSSGPSSTCACTSTRCALLGSARRARRRRRRERPWMKGYQFALAGPDLRRHQRDPAQRDRRARARPAPPLSPHAIRVHRRPARVPRRRARPARRASARRPPCAPAWTSDDRAQRRRRGPALARDGRARRAGARGAGGLGLGLVDLVLVLEETGYVAAARPDRRARRGGACRSCPTPAHRGGGRASTVTAALDGCRPRRVGRHAPTWSSLDAGDAGSACSRRDGVDASPGASRSTAPAACFGGRTRRRAVLAAEPVDRAAFDRGALGAAAQLLGLARRAARPHRRLRQRAPPVRRARRLVPGREAPPRRRPARASSSPAPRLPRRLVARRPATPTPPLHVSMAKALACDAAHLHRPGGPAVPRRHRLHVRVRPAPVHEARLGARRGLGRRRLAPRPARLGPRPALETPGTARSLAAADAASRPGRPPALEGRTPPTGRVRSATLRDLRLP